MSNIPKPTSRIPKTSGIPQPRTGLPIRTVTTKSSTTVIEPTGERTRTIKVSRRPAPEEEAGPSTSRPIEEFQYEHYVVPAQYPPAKIKDKQMYSSPPELRKDLTTNLPKDLHYYTSQAPPRAVKDRRQAQRAAGMDDMLAGHYRTPRTKQPTTQPPPESYSPLNQRITSTDDDDAFERSIRQEVGHKAQMSPGGQARQIGKRVIEVPQPAVMTKKGPESTLQQIVATQQVERSLDRELVMKRMTAIDSTEAGKAKKVDLVAETVDSKYRIGLETGVSKECITVQSSVTVTPSQTLVQKNVIRELTVEEVDPQKLSQLIDEETEDVENTLKMAPPDIADSSPLNYATKKNLQNLRLSPEAIAMLENSVLYPAPTADEPVGESPPQTMAALMNVMDKGLSPKIAPTKFVDALFEEKREDFVGLSSVGPTPFEDVVVPTTATKQILQQVAVVEEEIGDKPKDDIANELEFASRKEFAEIGPFDDETPPWEMQDLAELSELLGAEPITELEPIKLDDIDDLYVELEKGIDYFVDTNVPQYRNRVQFRGSRPPHFFPGYMLALPEIPQVIRVAKTPNEVFNAAWKSVQPKAFPDQSIMII